MTDLRREFPVWFSDGSPGMERDPANYFLLCLSRAFYAFALFCDLDEEDRNAYLDIGSGGGFITELVGNGFKIAIGVERRPEAREYATRVHNRGPVKYVSSIKEAVDHAPFNFVTMLEVIEHMSAEDGVALLKAVVPLITDGGTLYLSTPACATENHLNPGNPYHLHEYQPKELRELLEKFFKNVRISAMQPRTLNAVCMEPIR